MGFLTTEIKPDKFYGMDQGEAKGDGEERDSGPFGNVRKVVHLSKRICAIS